LRCAACGTERAPDARACPKCGAETLVRPLTAQELGRAHRKFGVPDHMIVKTARVLRERGAPGRLIHYDLAL